MWISLPPPACPEQSPTECCLSSTVSSSAWLQEANPPVRPRFLSHTPRLISVFVTAPFSPVYYHSRPCTPWLSLNPGSATPPSATLGHPSSGPLCYGEPLPMLSSGLGPPPAAPLGCHTIQAGYEHLTAVTTLMAAPLTQGISPRAGCDPPHPTTTAGILLTGHHLSRGFLLLLPSHPQHTLGRI